MTAHIIPTKQADPAIDRLYDDLWEALAKARKRVPHITIAATLGVLEMVKHDILLELEDE